MVGDEADGAGRRIRGIDIARALAIVGMLAVHIGPTDGPGLGGWLYASSHGRASILFILVAGVGVTLLTGSAGSSRARPRLTLAWRAVLLLPLGLALQELDHGVHVILQNYALLFALAMLAGWLGDRWLIALAIISASLGPLVYLWGRSHDPDVFDRSSTSVTDAPGEIVHGLVLSGPYPLIIWVAPFLLGIWLGRRDLRSTRSRAWLVVAGAATTVAAALTSHLLGRVLGATASPGEPGRLAAAEPHSQMPLWLIGATGSAVLLLGLSLLLADAAPRASWPLVATGQLAVTAYVAHLIALHAAPELLTSDQVGQATILVVAFTASILVAATLWRRDHARGPLELALRPPLLDRIFPRR